MEREINIYRAQLVPPPAAQGIVDVLCVGETMVMVSPTEPKPLHDPSVSLRLRPGGAESNVAASLAHLGYDVAWWSRVGTDPFGEHILTTMSSYGVNTDHVVRDQGRRTGVYFKNVLPERTEVYYYRDGSAASAMGPRDIELLPAWAQVLHTSGITAALSPGCDALLEELIIKRAAGSGLVSFDVNFRDGLWDVAQAAPRLLEFATAADIVFVGLDEAHVLWGTSTPGEVRALLRQIDTLIVKDAAHGATSFRGSEAAFEPALPVDVVEVVGAGDAFAAGYLAGRLASLDERRALRLGHQVAAHALRSTEDIPDLPERSALLQSHGRPAEPARTSTIGQPRL